MTSTPSVTRYRAKCTTLGRKRSEFQLTPEERAKVWEFIKALRAAAKEKEHMTKSIMELPPGWALETGTGGFGEKGERWVCVRNIESQCGQDFYEDRDQLIFNFLNALATHPGPAQASTQEPPEGFQSVFVNEGFGDLMEALARAHGKGYMPDAITEYYEGFDYRITQA